MPGDNHSLAMAQRRSENFGKMGFSVRKLASGSHIEAAGSKFRPEIEYLTLRSNNQLNRLGLRV